VRSQAAPELDLAQVIGATVKTAREEARWSQDELSERLQISQSMISRLEAGRCRFLDMRLASSALDLLGVRVSFDGQTIGLAGRREQNDFVHAACAGYSARRLTPLGWQVRLEVEVGSGRYRGWIDVLAFHEERRCLLVIEIKTELDDVGRIQRTLGWYGREAWEAAQSFGWRPRTATRALVLLDSVENDARVQANRGALKAVLPGTARDLEELVIGSRTADLRGAIALIDPRSRRRSWLRSARTDGRRTAAPYADYRDAAEKLHGRAIQRKDGISTRRARPPCGRNPATLGRP
jgi:transcriptional regulator with XRE-family HTH domain